MTECYLCPRLCGARREAGEYGFCGQSADINISRADLHMFEEPVISGKHGSGTIFFSGCSLRCVFCQNRAISRAISDKGMTLTPRELADTMLSLEEKGAHNINLVTPTHFADKIVDALLLVKHRLSIPVVYNSSGYERVETLRTLRGLVDIYMPDIKYASSELAKRYSLALDYPQVAIAAIKEMVDQTCAPMFDSDGMLKKGTLVRHLVLPAHRDDSIEVMRMLASAVPPDMILLSLMSQYTPEFALDSPHKNLHRRLTTFEYDSVLEVAQTLGFDGFSQKRDSASSVYTPDF